MQKSGKLQRQLIIPFLEVMNEVFDSSQFAGQVKIQFKENMDFLEKIVKMNLYQIGMETFSSVVYHFCKFQCGQQEFWVLLENSMKKNRDSMSIEQLTKCLLATSVNSRPFDERLFEMLMTQSLQKFHQSTSKDIWYCCLALSHRKVPV